MNQALVWCFLLKGDKCSNIKYVAYLEVDEEGELHCEPLLDHLVVTGDTMIKLFEDRLRVLEERTRSSFKWEKDELLDIAWIIGLAHDLAKSSTRYTVGIDVSKGRPGFKVSFSHHEVVSGILVFLNTREENPGIRRIGRLVARVISRHHAAMKNRHPASIFSTSCNNKFYKEVLAEIKEEFLGEVRGSCSNNELCKTIFRRPEILDHEEYSKLDLCRDIVRDLAKPTDSPSKQDRVAEFTLLNALTGILIVSDNIVAYKNRRSKSSTDYSTPLYIKHWLCELLEDCMESM
jgi:CRISPR/Cas system-associated endonuclease Cas3-HD